MSGIRLFFVSILVVAAVSVVFQAVGFFTPAWMIISEDIDVSKMSNSGVDSTMKTTTSSSSWNPTIPSNFGNFGSSHDRNQMPPEHAESENEESNNFDSGLGKLGNHLGRVKTSISFGLWFVNTCVEMMGKNICNTTSTTKLQNQMKSAAGGDGSNPMSAMMDQILPDWTTLQVLAVLAVLCAIAGVVTLIIFWRMDRDKPNIIMGLIVAAAWLASGVFIIAAVGKQATQLKNLNDLLQLSMSFIPDKSALSVKIEVPWALVMSGLGGFFAFVITGMILLRMLFRDRREAPGAWSQFSNRAV